MIGDESCRPGAGLAGHESFGEHWSLGKGQY